MYVHPLCRPSVKNIKYKNRFANGNGRQIGKTFDNNRIVHRRNTGDAERTDENETGFID